MIKICMRYGGDMDEAGSIYNNAMLKVFKSLANYQEEGKLNAWIKKVVVNAAIDQVRKRQRFDMTDISDAAEVNIPATAFHQISFKEIQAMILKLPDATRTVFNLYSYEGYKHKEIGALLGISEGTSKWHMNQARKLLSQELSMHKHSF